MSGETIGVTVGGFTISIPADSEAGLRIARAALEVMTPCQHPRVRVVCTTCGQPVSRD